MQKSQVNFQIKVTLTNQLNAQITARARKLGLTKASYLRGLAVEDLKCEEDERTKAKKQAKKREMEVDVSNIVRIDDLLRMI